MILAITAAIVVLAGLLIWRDKRRQRKWFLAKVHRLWGSVADREYTWEELESISHYAKHHEGERFMVDDITWNDLGMDQIFMLLNTTVSSCGEDVLYRMLRFPEFDSRVLDERERLIEYFRTHERERIQVQTQAGKVKKIGNISITDYIHVLKDVPRRHVFKYIFLACLTLACIVGLFFDPLKAATFLLLVMCFNGYIHMRDSKNVEPYLNCFGCILRLLKAADGFASVRNPEIQSYLDRIAAAREKMKGFRRGAFLVSSSSAIQDGLEAFVLSYLKVLFHVDMIKFYSMLRFVEGHEGDVEDLFAAMGELDALIAAASFREYLPCYAVPELWEREADSPTFLEAKELYHPLIADPVPNSVRMERGILVTGSNASGKSTFLKTVAIQALLAQTIHTCPARTFRGNFVKVMTSMALRDDLEGGESYYIVEIKSLQRILQECEKQEPVLCIVDEVLRGTNTIERIAASSRILRSLAAPNVLPLAATHDIELSYILEDCYDNYHFEEEIRDNDVIFNYQLKKGRATTRNAIRLLELIGYDPKIVRDAREAARRFEETGVWS